MRKLSEENIQEAATLYKEGATFTTLGPRFNVDPMTVRNAFRREGIPIRRSGGRVREIPEIEAREIIHRYQSGESQESIAASLHHSQSTISRLLRMRGISSPRRGSNWKGGRVTHTEGYIRILLDVGNPLSEMTDTQGYVAEHRLVMAQHLGRSLRRDETVHHVNGDRTDNRLENLQLRQGRHGKGVAMKCADCGSHNVTPDPLD